MRHEQEPIPVDGDRKAVRRRGKPARHESVDVRRQPDEDPLLAEIVRRLVAAYGPERIYLFGSHARGEAGPDSDYDLFVVVPDSAPAELRDTRLAYRALRGTGIATDVVVATRDYFDWMLEAAASLPATVQREGRVLYAA